MNEFEILKSKGTVVAVSDVHLGFVERTRQDFISFIDDELASRQIEYFIFLGDIFDFWRRSTINAIYENREVLQRLARLDVNQILYVIGNHDFTAKQDLGGFLEFCSRQDLQKFFKQRIRFDSKFVLQHSDTTYRFIHGYQTEYPGILSQYESICEELCQTSDKTGKFLSDIWDILTGKALRKQLLRHLEKPPEKRYSWYGKKVKERLLTNMHKMNLISEKQRNQELSLEGLKVRDIAKLSTRVKLKKNEFLVMGHTHRPTFKPKQMLANTGCWVKDDHRFFIIEDGKPNLRKWS